MINQQYFNWWIVQSDNIWVQILFAYSILLGVLGISWRSVIKEWIWIEKKIYISTEIANYFYMPDKVET